MSYKFAYRPYKRAFKEILQTPQGPWRFREGIIIRLEDENHTVGFGEISPLPSFGSETLDEAIAYCQIIGKTSDKPTISNIPNNLPCCRYALESALWDMEPHSAGESKHTLETSALISRGYKCIKEVESLLKAGYRVFKWKIGLEAVKEFTIYRQLKSILPEDARLRIDANASLNEDTAKYWLKQFEGGPVEYFEQPLPRDQIPQMRVLAATHPSIPIALDESASTFSAIKSISESGWRGPIIVKPALLGTLNEFIEWRKTSDSKLIYSSAYETAIGMQTLLRLAASHPSTPLPVGIGTLDYFRNDGLSLHNSSPRINFWRFTSADFEKIWQSL